LGFSNGLCEPPLSSAARADPKLIEFASQTNRSLPLKTLLANPPPARFCTTKTRTGHDRLAFAAMHGTALTCYT
jgi:hypothetical protein